MAYYRGVARDTAGNSLNEASVSVFDPDGTTLATIYSDEDLATALGNPFTTGADGVYEFYTQPGYYNIQVAKAGFTTVILSDQAVGAPFGFAIAGTGGSALKDGSGHDIDDNWGTLSFTEGYPSNAFSLDGDGKLQYDGNPKVWALIRGTIIVASDTPGVTFAPYFDIGGSSGTQVQQFIPTAANPYTVSWSTVAQIENGNKIFLGCEFAGGPATLTIYSNTSVEVTVLG